MRHIMKEATARETRVWVAALVFLAVYFIFGLLTGMKHLVHPGQEPTETHEATAPKETEIQ